MKGYEALKIAQEENKRIRHKNWWEHRYLCPNEKVITSTKKTDTMYDDIYDIAIEIWFEDGWEVIE